MYNYGCYLVNFDITHWFDSEEAASEYGAKSGYSYQLVAVKKKNK